MRGAAVVVACALGAGVFSVTACSLLTSLSGYSDGDGTADAAGDTSANPTDGSSGSDGPSADSSGDAADAALSRSALYAQAVLADKPLGYWRLEETSGDVAKDETGRHDGQCFDAPLRGEPGIAGSRGMQFPTGKTARLVMATEAYAFGGNAAHTIELWAKPGALRDYQWLATTEKTVAGGRNGWSLLGDVDGKIRYEFWRSDLDGGFSASRGALSDVVDDTAFNHVVIVYDGTTLKGFINDVAFAAFNDGSVVPNDGELTWGCDRNKFSCLDGWVIDELAIYASALSDARVQAHFQLGR